MNHKKRRLLETLPGWTDFCNSPANDWKARFEALRSLIGPEGRYDAVKSTTEEYVFLSNHLKASRNGRLRKWKERMLSSLPGWRTRCEQVRARPTFTRRQIAAMVRQYAAGSTLKDIASRYDVDKATIAALLRKENVTIRSTRRPDIDDSNLIAAYTNGSSVLSLAKASSATHSTIHKRLLKLGAVIRKGKMHDFYDLVLREYDKGRSGPDIATELKVSAESVYYILRKAGKAIRSNKPELDNKKIIIEYRKGKSATHLSREYCTSHHTILKLLRNANVPIRTMSDAVKLVKCSREYIAKSPAGRSFRITNLTQFCRNNGLSQGSMSAVVRGKRASHKGWTCEEVTK